jgi:hypothetical protein
MTGGTVGHDVIQMNLVRMSGNRPENPGRRQPPLSWCVRCLRAVDDVSITAVRQAFDAVELRRRRLELSHLARAGEVARLMVGWQPLSAESGFYPDCLSCVRRGALTIAAAAEPRRVTYSISSASRKTRAFCTLGKR